MLELIKNDWILYSLAILFVLLVVSLFVFLLRRKNKKEISFKNEVEFYKVPEEKMVQNKVEKELEEENELEKVLRKMQEELERRESEPIKTFEQEQEEKSIISYQELLQANNRMKELASEKKETSFKHETEEKEDEANRRFKNSEFISPIYGRLSNDYTYPIIKSFREKESLEEVEDTPEIALEKTLAEENESISIPDQIIEINRLSSEIRKSEEFLKALKEFRKKLD